MKPSGGRGVVLPPWTGFMGADMTISNMTLCECGRFIDPDTKFKDFIKTASGPSTPTFGHSKCGYIFNLVDGDFPRRNLSKKELKSIAMAFAEEKNLTDCLTQKFLLLVDRFKRCGTYSDYHILMEAYKQISDEGVK